MPSTNASARARSTYAAPDPLSAARRSPRTTGGGTPYGASHVSGSDGRGRDTSDDENAIAKALGRRLATLARQLAPAH